MLLYRRFIKSNMIDSAIEKNGVGVNLCNAPPKKDPEISSSSNPETNI